MCWEERQELTEMLLFCFLQPWRSTSWRETPRWWPTGVTEFCTRSSAAGSLQSSAQDRGSSTLAAPPAKSSVSVSAAWGALTSGDALVTTLALDLVVAPPRSIQFVFRWSVNALILPVFAVYDVLTGAVVSKLCGHDACVRDVSWHPYEDNIVSSSVSVNVSTSTAGQHRPPYWRCCAPITLFIVPCVILTRAVAEAVLVTL